MTTPDNIQPRTASTEEVFMLKTTFTSIKEMLEYNQAIMSALEALWEYEADKWNNDEHTIDKLCDPALYNTQYDEELQMFIIPCWLSCNVTYTGGWAENDPYIPYIVEIPVQDVEQYLKENYGYES